MIIRVRGTAAPPEPAGIFRQTTAPNAEARRLHEALGLALPPKILHLDTDPGA